MNYYLRSEVVKASFLRLRPQSEINANGVRGKSHKERSSGLLYFLSFNYVVNQCGAAPHSFKPDTDAGAKHRQLMKDEFGRLVRVAPSSVNPSRQVCELGYISEGEKEPDTRISSNFFTVPLKIASEQRAKRSYPRRHAPVLILGSLNSEHTWEIDYHPDWQENFREMLQTTQSQSPYTDLAIFALRDYEFSHLEGSLSDTLSSGLRTRYSDEFVAYWLREARKENSSTFDDPFIQTKQTHFVNDFEIDFEDQNRYEKLATRDTTYLVNRILYLENLLDLNEIDYDPE